MPSPINSFGTRSRELRYPHGTVRASWAGALRLLSRFRPMRKKQAQDPPSGGHALRCPPQEGSQALQEPAGSDL